MNTPQPFVPVDPQTAWNLVHANTSRVMKEGRGRASVTAVVKGHEFVLCRNVSLVTARRAKAAFQVETAADLCGGLDNLAPLVPSFGALHRKAYETLRRKAAGGKRQVSETGMAGVRAARQRWRTEYLHGFRATAAEAWKEYDAVVAETRPDTVEPEAPAPPPSPLPPEIRLSGRREILWPGTKATQLFTITRKTLRKLVEPLPRATLEMADGEDPRRKFDGWYLEMANDITGMPFETYAVGLDDLRELIRLAGINRPVVRDIDLNALFPEGMED